VDPSLGFARARRAGNAATPLSRTLHLVTSLTLADLVIGPPYEFDHKAATFHCKYHVKETDRDVIDSFRG
jgi:hypothetical protein